MSYCKEHVDDGATSVRGYHRLRRCGNAAKYDGLCPLHARQAGVVEALVAAQKARRDVWVVVAKREDASGEHSIEEELYFEARSERGARQAFAAYRKRTQGYSLVRVLPPRGEPSPQAVVENDRRP